MAVMVLPLLHYLFGNFRTKPERLCYARKKANAQRGPVGNRDQHATRGGGAMRAHLSQTSARAGSARLVPQESAAGDVHGRNSAPRPLVLSQPVYPEVQDRPLK